MTTEEFSNEFDVLLNSYSEEGININEYEKSVFLTEAQEELVKGLYSGRLLTDSLESTEELRRGLDSLIKTIHPEVKTESSIIGLDQRSTIYQLDDDVWYITYESVDLVNDSYCKDKKTVKVIPVRQDEWHKIKDNPFKRPNKRKVVRLDCEADTVELISEYPIENYTVRYLSRPNPIILTDLDEGLTINKCDKVTQCTLNTALHRLILESAVQLAIRRTSKAS